MALSALIFHPLPEQFDSQRMLSFCQTKACAIESSVSSASIMIFPPFSRRRREGDATQISGRFQVVTTHAHVIGDSINKPEPPPIGSHLEHQALDAEYFSERRFRFIFYAVSRCALYHATGIRAKATTMQKNYAFGKCRSPQDSTAPVAFMHFQVLHFECSLTSVFLAASF